QGVGAANPTLLQRRTANVRYWPLADIPIVLTNVRFWGQSGHCTTPACAYVPHQARCGSPSLLSRFCSRNKPLYLLQILGVASVFLVSLRFSIDAHRLYCSFGVDNVVGSQSTSDDDGSAHALYDLSVDFPAVGYTQRTYLSVARPMAV